MKLLIGLLCLSVLSSCASLNENQCRAGDWEAYGKIDGEKGYPAEYWREHQSACERYGAHVDRASYLRAREAGLKLYCTPESGYRAGRAGEEYFGVCEGAAAEAFKAQYAVGYRYHETLRRKREVEQALSEAEQRRAANPDNGVGAAVVDILGLSAESSRRHELTARRDQLDDELLRNDALAPTPNWQAAALSPASFSDGFGALTGTVIGFGSGHAIQGRFLEKGWIFTVSEVASIAALATLPSACRNGANTCQAIAVTIPLLAFIASKVWESVDVWRFFGGRMAGYPHLNALR